MSEAPPDEAKGEPRSGDRCEADAFVKRESQEKIEEKITCQEE
jgi:hypothetical protein